MQRFFTEHLLHSQQTFTLEPAIAKHAIKVLRYDVGAVFELADPKHRVYQATVQTTDPLTVEIGRRLPKMWSYPSRLRLFAASAKAIKLSGLSKRRRN